MKISAGKSKIMVNSRIAPITINERRKPRRSNIIQVPRVDHLL